MTAKRFYKTVSEIEDYRIYDDEEEDAYFVSCDEHTVDSLVKLLNELHEENQELRMDNDIKFWKRECIRESNTNSIFAFELGKAIDEGYVVSEKFEQMMEEWKKEIEKMKEKHQRLFE